MSKAATVAPSIVLASAKNARFKRESREGRRTEEEEAVETPHKL